MKIHICRKIDEDKFHSFSVDGDNLELVEIVDRKPFHRGFVGNFVPHYCRYKNKEYYVFGGIDYAYMHDIDRNGLYIIERRWETMKYKTAMRFLKRNQIKLAKHTLYGTGKPSFLKRWKECTLEVLRWEKKFWRCCVCYTY